MGPYNDAAGYTEEILYSEDKNSPFLSIAVHVHLINSYNEQFLSLDNY